MMTTPWLPLHGPPRAEREGTLSDSQRPAKPPTPPPFPSPEAPMPLPVAVPTRTNRILKRTPHMQISWRVPADTARFVEAMNEGPMEFRIFILLGYSNQKMDPLAYAEDAYLTLMQSNGGGVI
ncbi:hypothetical protein PVL29_014584 [Vitis rotundifolia]|uniref:Uncharacterized protein n=1 Tax=Vitis rotundifolia TaxID=103349 RepID=A0AA39DLB7_VITRO|nr:hypothetical protein PVL29_014584 [Vitis rotundifolia]